MHWKSRYTLYPRMWLHLKENKNVIIKIYVIIPLLFCTRTSNEQIFCCFVFIGRQRNQSHYSIWNADTIDDTILVKSLCSFHTKRKYRTSEIVSFAYGKCNDISLSIVLICECLNSFVAEISTRPETFRFNTKIK